MISAESLDGIVRELVPDDPISEFNMTWILKSPRASEGSIREIYWFLRGKGMEDPQIASAARTLGGDLDTIKRNHRRLSAIGLSNRKIISVATLLIRDPDTVDANYRKLSAIGLKDRNIASHAHLLGMNPDTIDRNCRALSALGLSDRQIASHAHLLGRDPDTIFRYYQHHIGLLRQDYQNRASGRGVLTSHAELLGITPATVEGNVQMLYSPNIDYNDGFLLGTTPGLKRKKMAWMLRELFNYRRLPRPFKEDAIHAMYDFIRANPKVLIGSIGYMEKNRERLREKAEPYRSNILPALVDAA